MNTQHKIHTPTAAGNSGMPSLEFVLGRCSTSGKIDSGASVMTHGTLDSLKQHSRPSVGDDLKKLGSSKSKGLKSSTTKRGGKRKSKAKLGSALEALNESFNASMNMSATSFGTSFDEDTCFGTVDSRNCYNDTVPMSPTKTRRGGRRPTASHQ